MDKMNIISAQYKVDLDGKTKVSIKAKIDDKDFVSNGFKHRSTGASENASGGTYIYMAFAEQPFKYANAK